MAKNSFVKCTVLVVDDDSTSLSIVSATLKSWKYDVVTVKSPVDALATIRIQKDDINLVFTDLHMPQMNGIELQKQINEEFNLPVIIMSSDDRESVILKCLASGAVFYMVKPVNPDDLKNVRQYAVGIQRGKSVFIEKMGSIDGGSSAEKISYEDIVSASSVNEDKHRKKNSKRKASKRGKEDEEGENTVPLKKAKLVWTNSLHNSFLQAIRHITLEKAVPKKILEFMNLPGLTRENVASHLQKYRIFLKKVAVIGSESAVRSSFASRHSSLTLRNAQDYAKIREKQPMRTSSFQAGHGGSISALNVTNFSSTEFPRRGATCSNTVSQAALSGNETSSQYQSLTGNRNPLYAANQVTYGIGSKGIGTDLLSHGSMSQGFTKLYQQKSQARSSDLYSNNIGDSPLNNFGSSGWKPSFSAGYDNMATIKDLYSTFDGIRINDAREHIGIGQPSQNPNVPNVSCGLLIGTVNQDVAAGFMGIPAFPYLARGESSSSVFDTAFAGVNKEAANPSVLSSLSQQQYGVGNNGENDFTFGQMNHVSVFDSIAHPSEQYGKGFNIDGLLFDLTDFQFPYQQEVGVSVLNPNFPNISYQAVLNLPTNQSQSPDFSSAYDVEENAPRIEPSLEQLQEIEEVPDSNANPSDYYDTNLDHNLNQQQGDENFINSDLNGQDQLENYPSGDQGWDEELINSLFSDWPF